MSMDFAKLATKEAIHHVETERARRWRKGLKHYRESEVEPFNGDPLAELLDELYDALNYLDVLRSKRDIPQWKTLTIENQLRSAALLALSLDEE